MFVLTILIVSISFGSVILDSNIQVLCSKKYFDNIYVKQSSDGTTVLLERMKVIDSKSNETLHSWDVLIGEEDRNFKPLDISYTTNGDKIYSATHFRQPKECPIDVTTVWTVDNIKYSHTTKWEINDFFLRNIKAGKRGTLKVEYVGRQLQAIEHKDKNKKPSREKVTNDTKIAYIESSQLSSISMIAILCKASEKSLYAIVEEEPPNAGNRTQFVARLMVENFNISHNFGLESKTVVIHNFRSEQRFWLKLMDQTIVEFLGIDCEEDSEIIPTDTLFVMFWVLLGLGIILFIADTGLIVKRNAPQPEPETEITTYRRASRLGPSLNLFEKKR